MTLHEGESYIFEHECYISALEHIRLVLLVCINTIYKYGHDWGVFSKMHMKFHFFESGTLNLRMKCMKNA